MCRLFLSVYVCVYMELLSLPPRSPESITSLSSQIIPTERMTNDRETLVAAPAHSENLPPPPPPPHHTSPISRRHEGGGRSEPMVPMRQGCRGRHQLRGWTGRGPLQRDAVSTCELRTHTGTHSHTLCAAGPACEGANGRCTS